MTGSQDHRPDTKMKKKTSKHSVDVFSQGLLRLNICYGVDLCYYENYYFEMNACLATGTFIVLLSYS